MSRYTFTFLFASLTHSFCLPTFTFFIGTARFFNLLIQPFYKIATTQSPTEITPLSSFTLTELRVRTRKIIIRAPHTRMEHVFIVAFAISFPFSSSIAHSVHPISTTGELFSDLRLVRFAGDGGRFILPPTSTHPHTVALLFSV